MAIPLPQDLAERVLALQERLAHTRADVRWVPQASYHITVKFLGETDERLLPEIARRITNAAAQVPQFPLDLEGTSRFPERGPARVIVARVHSPDQRITKLHRLLDSAMGGIGLPMDTRVLVPHLTLGRVSSNRGLNRLLRLVEKHDLDFIGSFLAEKVVLYSSNLAEGGPSYQALHHADMAVPAAPAVGL